MDDLSQKALVSVLDKLKPRKLLVVGDLMLDQYIWGKVERISPEGPIPVLHVSKEEFRLGGAANVAVNLKHLDCLVYPVGLVGTDHSGDKLLNIFHQLNIPTTGILREETFQTIVKQRAITSQQQLLRIDYESKSPSTSNNQQKLWEIIENILPDKDGVIISDYAKGVINRELTSKLISAAQKLKIPVICDPGKGVDYTIYKGITAIKPNRIETEQTTGMTLVDQKSALKAAQKLKEICQSEFVAISMDKDGILYYKNSEDYRFLESRVPEVYDVTGAGDTLISTIAVLLANGVRSLQATYIANVAAGLETSHFGVVPIPWSEIIRTISGDSLSHKITSQDKLLELLKGYQSQPLIFTNGYFDNISAGHLRFLLEINKLPGKLIVAINSDNCIKRQKGALPLLKESDRARLLASMENVQHVVIFDDDDASALIRSIKPGFVVKGEQFRGKNIPESDAINEVGATIEYIPHFSWDEKTES